MSDLLQEVPFAQLTDSPADSPLTELHKYELVNSADTFAKLHSVLAQLGLVQGSRSLYPAEMSQLRLLAYQGGRCSPNALTRSYGIRQQAMYLRYYEGLSE